MPEINQSILEPLPQARRRSVFLVLVTLFIIAVPIFVFYATGYRYDFYAIDGAITATGGMYISVDAKAGELYLDNRPVYNVRIFRNASYLQNLNPGVHKIHVQSPGLHTWVKELPVYPHIVTEAEAFLLPERPQVRVIAEYITQAGNPVNFGTSSAESIRSFASTSLPFFIATSSATSTFIKNSEYDYVRQLFGTSTESEATLLSRVTNEVSGAFQFATSQNSEAKDLATTSLATTTKIRNDIQLSENNGRLTARYIGDQRNIPYYFCVARSALASTTELYGAQVMSGIKATLAHATEDLNEIETVTETSSRICRNQIIINTKQQPIEHFDFLPGNSDLVLVQVTDGIYVIEIDDRSWQNTQKVYPASAEAVIIDNDRIYIKDRQHYFELLTSLLAS